MTLISRMDDFGGKLSAGKAVNVNLPSVGAGRRTGKRVQLILQFIGIIRQRVQILALDHDRTGIVVGTGIEPGTLVGDGDLLLIDCDDEGKILHCGAARLNGHALSLRQRKTRCGHGDDINTGSKLRELVRTIGTGLYGVVVPSSACTVTVALTTRAPEGSVTTPFNAPVGDPFAGNANSCVAAKRLAHSSTRAAEIFASDHSCIMRLLVDAVFRRHPSDWACGHNE